MASTAAQPTDRQYASAALSGRRYDHFFFSGMALLLLAIVFVGFAPTYYLAGLLHAPLPSRIIHIHAAVFTCWILLFVAQVSLVSAHRVDMHRRLGVIGFLLASAMVVIGLMAATDSLARNFPPGRDALFFYVVPTSNMLVFGVLMAFAYRTRTNPAAHKRLILIATSGLTVAAINRWPIALVHHNVFAATRVSYLFVLLLVAYDFWSTCRIHRATLWASAFLVLVFEIRFLVAKTMAWHVFAAWIRSKLS
jgi:FtsH-binding integral membrane protein